MSDPTLGLILAGGLGTRLGGVAKHRIRIAGRTLLAHVRARLVSQCDEILFSTRAGLPLSPSEAEGLIVVPDPACDSFGPASGLLAGARWCAQNAPDADLVTVAVDTPLLPRDFARRCRSVVPPGGVTIAQGGGQRFPTHALWTAQALARLTERVLVPEQGRGPSLHELIRTVPHSTANFEETPGISPFSGVNTLRELLALSRVVASDESV